MRPLALLLFALGTSVAQLAAQTTISFEPSSVLEGGHLVFKVKADKVVGSELALDVHITGITSTLNSDFTAPAQQITFPIDTTEQTQEIHVHTLDDDIVEGEETIRLFLTTSAQKVTLSDGAVGTIRDDDAATITILDARAEEGDSLKFLLTLDKEVVGGFALDVEISHGSVPGRKTSDNTAGSLKRPIPDLNTEPRKVLFKGRKGEQQEVSVVALLDKTPNEGEEEFYVTLRHSGSKKILLPPVAVGIIHDDSPCRHCPSLHLLKTATKHELEFFGDGALVKTFQDDSDLAANTGLGVRWTENFSDYPRQRFGLWSKVEIEGHINVASTVDSVSASYNSDGSISNRREFGRSILVPKSAGQSGDLRLTMTNRQPIFGIISGFYFRYVGANRNWQRSVAIDTLGNSEIRRDQVNMHLFRAGIFHDFVNYGQRDDFSVQLRLGYTTHWIGGDLSLDQNAVILDEYIRSDQQRHRGWEAAFNFRLSNLEAEFAYTSLYNEPGTAQIAGLHNGRLVTTIRFVGGFKAKLDKSN